MTNNSKQYKPLTYLLILIIVSLSACSGLKENTFMNEHQTKAEQAFNADAMIASLEQIKQWHQNHQTEVAPALNQGVDKVTIEKAFADLPCQPTEELIQLWAWHNGTQDIFHPFIWYHNFLSLEKAMVEYERLTKNPLLGWQKNWIPIFEFETEWYFVECYEENKMASPVGYYFIENTEVYYSYINLTTMLETAATLFDEEAVIWSTEDDGMVEDLKKVFEIQQTLNEGTQFPYYVP